MTLLLMCACGPQSFQSASAITIMGGEKPPEPEKPLAELKDDHIVIHQKVQFDVNQATIRPESMGLLAEVAKIIQAHPEITQLRVEGYASDEGTADHNLKLSRARAAAVKAALIDNGVQAERLTSEGYGETKPLVQGTSEEARIKNRRVEFHVLSRGDS